MTKSKNFWAAMALVGLAVMVYSGWSIYGRIAQHFSGDAIEVRPVPMPPPSADEPAAQPKETPEERADKEAKTDREEEEKAGKPQPPAAKAGEKAKTAKPAAAKAGEGGKVKAVKTPFEYKDAAAKSVAISGSFTSWKEKKMSRRNGVWKTEIYILPGTYPYHFTVDGRKKLDPGKPKAPTGDSLITVN